MSHSGCVERSIRFRSLINQASRLTYTQTIFIRSCCLFTWLGTCVGRKRGSVAFHGLPAIRWAGLRRCNSPPRRRPQAFAISSQPFRSFYRSTDTLLTCTLTQGFSRVQASIVLSAGPACVELFGGFGALVFMFRHSSQKPVKNDGLRTARKAEVDVRRAFDLELYGLGDNDVVSRIRTAEEQDMSQGNSTSRHSWKQLIARPRTSVVLKQHQRQRKKESLEPLPPTKAAQSTLPSRGKAASQRPLTRFGSAPAGVGPPRYHARPDVLRSHSVPNLHPASHASSKTTPATVHSDQSSRHHPGDSSLLYQPTADLQPMPSASLSGPRWSTLYQKISNLPESASVQASPNTATHNMIQDMLVEVRGLPPTPLRIGRTPTSIYPTDTSAALERPSRLTTPDLPSIAPGEEQSAPSFQPQDRPRHREMGQISSSEFGSKSRLAIMGTHPDAKFDGGRRLSRSEHATDSVQACSNQTPGTGDLQQLAARPLFMGSRKSNASLEDDPLPLPPTGAKTPPLRLKATNRVSARKDTFSSEQRTTIYELGNQSVTTTHSRSTLPPAFFADNGGAHVQRASAAKEETMRDECDAQHISESLLEVLGSPLFSDGSAQTAAQITPDTLPSPQADASAASRMPYTHLADSKPAQRSDHLSRSALNGESVPTRRSTTSGVGLNIAELTTRLEELSKSTNGSPREYSVASSPQKQSDEDERQENNEDNNDLLLTKLEAIGANLPGSSQGSTLDAQDLANKLCALSKKQELGTVEVNSSKGPNEEPH